MRSTKRQNRKPIEFYRLFELRRAQPASPHLTRDTEQAVSGLARPQTEAATVGATLALPGSNTDTSGPSTTTSPGVEMATSPEMRDFYRSLGSHLIYMVTEGIIIPAHLAPLP